jgi:trans-AT polyketide synthase, acyltransferase and oxidoreductase domains
MVGERVRSARVRPLMQQLHPRFGARWLIEQHLEEHMAHEIVPHSRRLPDLRVRSEDLGNPEFKKEYGVKYAYTSGGMYRGIASKAIVLAMGRAGFMGFLGTAALTLEEIEEDLNSILRSLAPRQPYGMNLICNLSEPSIEMRTVDLYLEKGVRVVEAAAFMQITPALVMFRLAGLRRDRSGAVVCDNKIVAKVSRPEVAQAFMSPAPERIVRALLNDGRIAREQAELSRHVPISYDICVEADSGGHTDRGVAMVLMPAMRALSVDLSRKFAYKTPIRVGLAGGIGTPEAVAAAFVMGADFVTTGSINQCTVEAGTSDSVKDMLQDINIHDTAYAPAGDMFEIGARVQVLKKGTLFSARANKLYALYGQYNALEEIPAPVRKQIEERYFKKSMDDVWEDAKRYLKEKNRVEEMERAERDPKYKMVIVFRWYFAFSTRVAMKGEEQHRADYQVHTGPALGAFNQWVKSTSWRDWRCRHVDQIAMKLMNGAAELLQERLHQLSSTVAGSDEKAVAVGS